MCTLHPSNSRLLSIQKFSRTFLFLVDLFCNTYNHAYFSVTRHRTIHVAFWSRLNICSEYWYLIFHFIRLYFHKRYMQIHQYIYIYGTVCIRMWELVTQIVCMLLYIEFMLEFTVQMISKVIEVSKKCLFIVQSIKWLNDIIIQAS